MGDMRPWLCPALCSASVCFAINGSICFASFHRVDKKNAEFINNNCKTIFRFKSVFTGLQKLITEGVKLSGTRCLVGFELTYNDTGINGYAHSLIKMRAQFRLIFCLIWYLELGTLFFRLQNKNKISAHIVEPIIRTHD